MPVAIRRQDWRCTARDGVGEPGERIAGRNARSARHCRRASSGTSLVFLLQSAVATVEHLHYLEVLRRPVESTLDSMIGMHDASYTNDALSDRHVKGVNDQLRVLDRVY